MRIALFLFVHDNFLLFSRGNAISCITTFFLSHYVLHLLPYIHIYRLDFSKNNERRNITEDFDPLHLNGKPSQTKKYTFGQDSYFKQVFNGCLKFLSLFQLHTFAQKWEKSGSNDSSLASNCLIKIYGFEMSHSRSHN